MTTGSPTRIPAGSEYRAERTTHAHHHGAGWRRIALLTSEITWPVSTTTSCLMVSPHANRLRKDIAYHMPKPLCENLGRSHHAQSPNHRVLHAVMNLGHSRFQCWGVSLTHIKLCYSDGPNYKQPQAFQRRERVGVRYPGLSWFPDPVTLSAG